MRQILSLKTDGDRQFVSILSVISIYGLEEVAEACSEAIDAGAASRDVVLNILARSHDDPVITPYEMPPHLPELKVPPLANCRRYDELLSECLCCGIRFWMQ